MGIAPCGEDSTSRSSTPPRVPADWGAPPTVTSWRLPLRPSMMVTVLAPGGVAFSGGALPVWAGGVAFACAAGGCSALLAAGVRDCTGAIATGSPPDGAAANQGPKGNKQKKRGE